MITAHNLEQEKPGDALAMLVVGKNKAGKSELASTAPKPVLFLDADLRADSLAGKKGVFALSFADPSDTNQQPTAYNEMLDTIAKLERSDRTLNSLRPEWPADKIATLVFDSIMTISNAARRYVLYTNPKELAVVISLGGQQYRVPRSWHGWGSEQQMVESLIMRARAIKSLNVIAILHEVMEEDERSTEDTPIYTGKVELYPRRYNSLVTHFNEVWRVTRNVGRVPTVTVQPDGVFTKASTALNIDNNQITKPDICEIIAIARRNGQPTASK